MKGEHPVGRAHVVLINPPAEQIRGGEALQTGHARWGLKRNSQSTSVALWRDQLCGRERSWNLSCRGGVDLLPLIPVTQGPGGAAAYLRSE